MKSGDKPKAQQGFTLVIALIILLVLSILVATSSQSVLLQERMAAATRDSQIALQAAEAGLAIAEDVLEPITGTSEFGAKQGWYAQGTAPTDVFDPISWNSTVSYSFKDGNGDTELTGSYFIEHLGLINQTEDASGVEINTYGQTVSGGTIDAFRIVSKGSGLANGSAERILVSYYGKRI